MTYRVWRSQTCTLGPNPSLRFDNREIKHEIKLFEKDVTHQIETKPQNIQSVHNKHLIDLVVINSN